MNKHVSPYLYLAVSLILSLSLPLSLSYIYIYIHNVHVHRYVPLIISGAFPWIPAPDSRSETRTTRAFDSSRSKARESVPFRHTLSKACESVMRQLFAQPSDATLISKRTPPAPHNRTAPRQPRTQSQFRNSHLLQRRSMLHH